MDSGRGGGDVLIAEAVTMQLYERHTTSGGRSSRAKRTSTRPGYKPSFSSSVIRAPTQPEPASVAVTWIGERAPDLACFSAAAFSAAMSIFDVLAGDALIFDCRTLLRAAHQAA
jgi:hypothetical protein